MQCSACAAAVPEDDLFCENCGAALHAAAAEDCVCAEVDEDGFCLRCGRRVRRPASDHVEEALSAEFAGVSDRGQRHERNEDRFGICAGAGGYGLVVCDGVSTSQSSETASAAVVEGVVAVLAEALQAGSIAEPETVLRRALVAGEANLVARTARVGGANPPSTTVVAALVRDGQATVAWVGDSRAYWVDAVGARALTRDHSWLNEVVASGQVTVEQARRSPQAHAITRWVGADAGEASAPEVVQVAVPGPGVLLLCSDGLWNYAPTDEAMGDVLREVGEGDALAVAKGLVRFANERGGQDNVSVIVLRLG